MTSRGITKPRLAYFRSYRDKRILRRNTILPKATKSTCFKFVFLFWLQAATVPRALTMPSQSFFHPSPSRQGTPQPWLVQLHPHLLQAAHPFPCILSRRHLVSKTVVVASPSWLQWPPIQTTARRAMCSHNLIPLPCHNPISIYQPTALPQKQPILNRRNI